MIHVLAEESKDDSVKGANNVKNSENPREKRQEDTEHTDKMQNPGEDQNGDLVVMESIDGVATEQSPLDIYGSATPEGSL